MPDIYDWSATANDNDDADSSINWLEGQLPGTVNGSARNMMKRVKELLTDLGGTGTVGGTANAITVTSAIATLASGKMVTFVATAANTSATVTLAVNGLTAKNIRKIDSSGGDVALIPGDIVIGHRCRVHYDSTANSAAGAWILTNPKQEARYTPGHLQGLTLSNNGSDATNDIDIAVGSARSSDDSANIDLTSALTKRLDVDWSAGTGNGMRYSGAAITNTTYHIWLVKSSAGVVDVYADPSATAATVLGHLQAETGGSTYLYLRRIGSIIRESAAIVGFTQIGDEFLRNSQKQDQNGGTLTSTAALITCGVPTGIKVQAIVTCEYSNSGTVFGYISSPDQTDAAASSSNFNMVTNVASIITTFNGAVRTNTSGQIRARSDASTGASYFQFTRGWIDTRGRV